MSPRRVSGIPFTTLLFPYIASPLYIGKDVLNNADLQVHARRFRDILAGDVLRGVRVGLGSEDDTLARVGALQTVVWKVFRRESEWAVEDTTEETLGESGTESTHNHGILVEVNYEKANYTAILIRSTPEDDMDVSIMQSSDDESVFLRLPLLLTRMPLSLRETFIQYVCQIFDTRVSALKLEGNDLTKSFEQYTSNTINEAATAEERQVGIQKIIKEIQISIGFDIPDGSATLKTIETILPGGSTSYIKAHLALDLNHEKVKIVKIACGAFVLGEGRLKLTQPSSVEHEEGGQYRATRQLLNDLVNIASRRGLLGEK
ncbi:c0105103-ff0a-49c7-8239-46bb67933724 [Sclerotinia trifoliorum]|uniref:C0105103-ff0a-49c7-8239-46bb67933724 n=1 Tax=Sclerotinia trifoliorum TaxID=28548 RepID=A0A8H2W2V7_9HELO|nr:c0105103-ff0a-49c7-8239-46bb67933724 [Sclerotinia trifoliorum]